MVGMAFYSVRWIVQDSQASYHAGVSAALFVLYTVTFLQTLSFRRDGGFSQAIDWVTEDTNKAYKVLEAHNDIILAVVNDLSSKGMLSKEAVVEIKAAKEKLRSDLGKKT